MSKQLAKSTQQEVITSEKIEAIDFSTFNTTKEELKRLSDMYTDLPQIDTKDGYSFFVTGIASSKKLRVGIENIRKDKKKIALDYGRKLDEVANKIKGEIAKIEEPMQKIKKEHDAEIQAAKEKAKRVEQERKDLILSNITDIRNLPSNYINSSPDEIQNAVEELTSRIIHGCYDEFEAPALDAKEKTLSTLREMETKAEAKEKEESKLKKDREEFERIKLEAEKKRKREEEKDEAERERLRQEAKDKEESELKAAREKEAEERAERETKEREEAEEARKKREAEEGRLAKERADLERREAEIEAKEKAGREKQQKEEAEQLRKKKELADKKKQAEIKEKVISALMRQDKGEAALYVAIKDGKIPYVRLVGEE